MSLKPLFSLMRDGRLSPLLGVGAGLTSFYKITWLAAAGECGLLGRLSAGPATFDSLAEFFAASGQGCEALEAWLQMGVRLKLLSLSPRGYTLRGLAKALALPENDATLAMVEEVSGLHHKLIAATLPKLRGGQLWTLADQDGELIARSSRILEAFQAELIRNTFPARGALTSGAGRLPAEDELVTQLRQAGYGAVKTNNLLPGDRFVAFQAFRA